MNNLPFVGLSFWKLCSTNLKLVYRNTSGAFWTLVMPVAIYVALSVLPIGRIAGGDFNYSDYVLPGIIAMVIMQGGIYGLAYWMVDLKSRGVLKRLMVTPISKVELVLSLLFARVVIILVQVIVLTSIGVTFFGASFYGNFVSTLVFAVLGGFVFLLVGLLISTLADTYEAAAPITAAIGLPLTFLGNIFYPIESLPKSLEIVGRVLPITYLADGLRQVYTGPFVFGDVARDMGILLAWLVVILLIVLWRFRLEE